MGVDDFFSTDTGSSTTGTASLAITVPRGVAAGKKVVIAQGRSDIAGSTVVGLLSVTDSKGNTWHVNAAVSIRANQGGVAFAWADITTALVAGDTITVTVAPSGATAAQKFLDVWVCSSVATGAPNATTGTTATANTNSGPNGTSASPTGSLTTTVAGCLILAAAYMGAGAVPATAQSGYTLDSTRTTTTASNKGWTSEHGTEAATGAHSPSIAGASSSAWAFAAIALAPGNAAPTATATATPNTNVEPGTVITLTGTDSDTDGTIVSRSWTCSDPNVVIAGAATRNATARAPATLAGETVTFTYTVTDNGGATGAATAPATVLAAPAAIMTAAGWAPASWEIIQ